MAAAPSQESAAPADGLRSLLLHGPDGLPGGTAEFFDRVGRPVWDGRSGTPVAVLFHRTETMRSPTLWSSPFTAWIDLAGLGQERLDRLLDRAGNSDFLASLTTAAAHDLHVAHRLVATLRDRGRLSEPAASDIEFALHEAISNALLHGNLELESVKGSNLGDLCRFSTELTSRLGNPALSARRVEVTIRFGDHSAIVEVSDEGCGFAPRPRQPACSSGAGEMGPRELGAGESGSGDRTDGASGRGLVLIAGIASRLELLDGGRRTRMEFAL